MKRDLYYFLLSLKKNLRILPCLLAVLAVLAVFAGLIISDMAEEKTLARVGICGNTDDAYIGIATTLLTETETLEMIEYSSEEDALTALKKNEIQGFATLPDGFMAQAMRGKNIPFTYTVMKKPASLSHSLTKEIVGSISPVLNNSQNAVYGMRQYLKDTNNRSLLTEETDKMAVRYVMSILERDRLFNRETVGIADYLDTQGYYTSAVAVLFVLICGVTVTPRMIKSHMSLPRLLRSRGIGAMTQTLCEWGAFNLVLYMVLIFFTAIIGNVGYGIKLLPVVMLLSAMQFFICELSGATVSGLLLQFFTTVILSYVSGLFYPSYFFPTALQRIAEMLPVGQAFSLARQTLSERATASDVLMCIAVTAVILTIASAVRRLRMRGDRA